MVGAVVVRKYVCCNDQYFLPTAEQSQQLDLVIPPKVNASFVTNEH